MQKRWNYSLSPNFVGPDVNLPEHFEFVNVAR